MLAVGKVALLVGGGESVGEGDNGGREVFGCALSS